MPITLRFSWVSDTTVRKGLASAGIQRDVEFQRYTGEISAEEIQALRQSAEPRKSRPAKRSSARLTKEHVGRVIAKIGEEAGIVVQMDDPRNRATAEIRQCP